MSLTEANLHWRYTDGDIIAPWYTLPCLQWLKSQPTSQWKVFEYGAGYSTIWWRLNCSSLCSVDHNREWAKAVGAEFEPDKDAYIKMGGRSPRFTVRYSLWNLIIVDGIHREECVEFCLPYIKPGGYLIIDNYGSEDYDIARTEALLSGWECVIHKQPNHSTWQTAVFQKPIAP